MVEPVRRQWAVCAIALILLVFSQVSRGYAAEPAQQSLLFQADNLAYDRDTDTVTATGNVEAAYGERLLFADQISFNQTTGIVTAAGNVVLTDPAGDTLFAEEARLTDDLRDGVIRGIGLRLADNSALAATEARRTSGRYTELRQAVYSPCKLCPAEGKTVPTWQIKAQRVRHDQEAQQISYNNAFLEAFGVPVFYTPYFSHPDPSVERKSGFLAPSFGSSSELGRKIEIPYYWAVNPSRDITFSPLYTSKEGPVMKLEYRERTRRGRMQFSGSVTRADERDDQDRKTGDTDTRGHIFGRGLFAIDDNTVWGFNVERATDDTYLSRYDITGNDTLTSRLFSERTAGRNYGAVDFLLFQGLNEQDDPGLTPMILPLLQYSAVGEPSANGDRFSFDVNALVLQRTDGQDTQRLSLEGGWRREYISAYGEAYSLFASLRGDAYYLTDTSGPGSDNRLEGRALPRIGLEWRLPLVRPNQNFSQVVEPIVQAIYSPYGGNPSVIPNEDSGSFEFDDTNLFSATRFPGLDRWEGGPRANVGLKWGAYGNGGGYTTVLVGQVFRLNDDTTFAVDSGLDDRRSDYVGRIALGPVPWFSLLHRFRLDRDTLGYNRNEIDLVLGPERARLEVGYVRLARELTDEALVGREELKAEVRLQISEYWSARASTRRDMEQNSAVSTRAGLFYSDECVDFGVTYNRRFTRDRDVEPSTSIGFKIALRHLG